MERFSKVIDNIKSFDLSSIANDKVVMCLAIVGLAASTKFVAETVMDYKSKREPES